MGKHVAIAHAVSSSLWLAKRSVFAKHNITVNLNFYTHKGPCLEICDQLYKIQSPFEFYLKKYLNL